MSPPESPSSRIIQVRLGARGGLRFGDRLDHVLTAGPPVSVSRTGIAASPATRATRIVGQLPRVRGRTPGLPPLATRSRGSTGRTRAPASALWNGPALVVTGAIEPQARNAFPLYLFVGPVATAEGEETLRVFHAASVVADRDPASIGVDVDPGRAGAAAVLEDLGDGFGQWRVADDRAGRGGVEESVADSVRRRFHSGLSGRLVVPVRPIGGVLGVSRPGLVRGFRASASKPRTGSSDPLLEGRVPCVVPFCRESPCPLGGRCSS